MAETLREFMAEYGAEKRARYERFGELMGAALRAGNYAAAGVRAVPGAPRERGSVWVKLDDGRSTFARFVREHRGDEWRRGGRELGNYLPAPFDYLDEGLAWARAVAEELGGGDVKVTVGQKAVAEAPDGGRDET